MDDLKEIFKSYVRTIKYMEKTPEGKPFRNEDVAKKLGYSREYLSTLMGKDGKVLPEHIDKIKSAFPNTPFEESEITSSNITPSNNSSGINGRIPKTQTNPDIEGVIFVPIAAQANYTQHYTEPLFINQLERIYIPGFPYRGDKYRIFEVAGDSMEPTFKEGYYVVGEYQEAGYWNTSIQDYYVYVIVTESRIMLKRIFKKSSEEYVLISDNEEFHPQFVIKVSDIKEIWYVRRKIDWEMPPPKRFEIKI